MSSDRHRTDSHGELEEAVRHSAFEDFRRDERRPAVLLLSALLLAAAFFALGIMFGRWMADSAASSADRPSNTVNQSSAPFVALVLMSLSASLNPVHFFVARNVLNREVASTKEVKS